MTADQVRAAMPPDMVAACEALKARFGARLVYLETPTLTIGDARLSFAELDSKGRAAAVDIGRVEC